MRWMNGVVLGLLWGLVGCSPQHPSDAAMLQNFKRHRAGFETLVGMIRSDRGLERVGDDWTRPENPASIGVEPQRIAAYRSLFKTLGIPEGFYAFHNPEDFSFLASTVGLGISGSSKGYAYLQQPPTLVVNQLDGYRRADGQSFAAYRRIEEKWYLYLDYED